MGDDLVLCTARLVLRPVVEDGPAEVRARLLAVVHEDAGAPAPTRERLAQAHRIAAKSAAERLPPRRHASGRKTGTT